MISKTGKHRVVGRYIGEKRFNVFQERKKFLCFYWWKDIEVEYVPEYARIQLGVYGGTEWKSELFERLKGEA